MDAPDRIPVTLPADATRDVKPGCWFPCGATLQDADMLAEHLWSVPWMPGPCSRHHHHPAFHLPPPGWIWTA